MAKPHMLNFTIKNCEITTTQPQSYQLQIKSAKKPTNKTIKNPKNISCTSQSSTNELELVYFAQKVLNEKRKRRGRHKRIYDRAQYPTEVYQYNTCEVSNHVNTHDPLPPKTEEPQLLTAQSQPILTNYNRDLDL